MANAGTVNVNLVAQTASFVANMKSAGASVDGFGNKLGTVDALTSSLGKLALRASPIAAIGAAFKTAFSEASRLDDISDATGLAASEIVGFERAAMRAGVSVDGLSQAVMRMNVVVGQAIGGNDEAAKKLAKIGLSVSDLLGLSPSEQFKKIGTAIGGISDQAVKAAMSQELLGKSSAKLIGMLGDLNKQKIDPVEAERIDKASEALNEFADGASMAFGRMKTQVMTTIGVALGYWAEKIPGVSKEYQALEAQWNSTSTKIAKDTVDLADMQDKALHDTYIKRLKQENDAGDKLRKLREDAYKNADALNMESLDKETAEKVNHSRKIAEIDEAAKAAGKKGSQEYLDAIAIQTQIHEAKIQKIKADSLEKQKEDAAKALEEQRAMEAETRSSNMNADRVLQEMIDKGNRDIDDNEEDAARKTRERIRDEEALTRGKIETGRAYAESLGNIIQMTDALKDKSTEAFYIDKAAKTASAIINAWVGYTAAMTIPPPAGPILAGTTLGAGMFAASQIAAQTPGRANGGAVNANSLYEVAEKGPEILESGGKTYLMNGDQSGRVQPIDAGGNQRVVVNVNNLPGQNARVTESSANGQQTINIDIIDSMVAASVVNGRSQTSRAIKSQFGLNAARGAQ